MECVWICFMIHGVPIRIYRKTLLSHFYLLHWFLRKLFETIFEKYFDSRESCRFLVHFNNSFSIHFHFFYIIVLFPLFKYIIFEALTSLYTQWHIVCQCFLVSRKGTASLNFCFFWGFLRMNKTRIYLQKMLSLQNI